MSRIQMTVTMGQWTFIRDTLKSLGDSVVARLDIEHEERITRGKNKEYSRWIYLNATQWAKIEVVCHQRPNETTRSVLRKLQLGREYLAHRKKQRPKR